MSRRYTYFFLIIVVLAFTIWVALPGNQTFKTVLGLDLRGGLQVLLEADLPANVEVDPQSLADARSIVENRANGLGVSEVVFQVAGARRIVGEFPGLTNTEEVLAVLKETGMLEFVDLGSTQLGEGTVIKTDYSLDPNAKPAPTAEATPAADATAATPAPTDKVWHTVMTGKDLKSVAVVTGQLNQPVVEFKLSPDGQKIFADYTTKNQGKFLAIVLDKKIISAPVIKSAITEGSGIIEGNFNRDTANALAIQLRYGSLPIPLKVVQSRVIGPTLGQDSLNRSMLAGLIGFMIVVLFMIIYYRLPGVTAVFAIITYALLTFALFKIIPVTLSLSGIAGFLLSTGSALDSNILIFERFKEELRAGRTLQQALDLGWKRAWPSIRDSNVAALITSAILFWFGSQYGATIVKGFALTLALGVVISVLTAVFVTRTFLGVAMDILPEPEKHMDWFGV